MSNLRTHERYMRRCIELARRALASDDAAVGALVVLNDEVVGEGIEGVRATGDVTAHAEIRAIRAACDRLSRLNLAGATLYTSVAPCIMCAYAIRLARVSTVVSGTQAPGATRALNGAIVLGDADILPGRPPPRVIDGVLGSQCRALIARR